MLPRVRAWLQWPVLIVAILAGGEIAARLDDLVRYDVPFLAPLDDPGVGEDPDVPRNPRLALLKQLRKLTDRQFHAREQGKDPQSRRVRHGLEQLCQR